MADLKDFAKVKDVPGVDEYVLVRQDGYVMLQDAHDHEGLGHVVRLSGHNCDTVKTGIASRFNFFLFHRDSGKHILVFPVGSYYLGIIQSASAESSLVAHSVQHFIQTLIARS